jgi:hypothetical protein
MGGDRAYRQGLRAAMDLDEAMDHIDQIYSAQILGIYGVTLALVVSTEEFDSIMNLTEKPPVGGLDSMFLDVFISVLQHVPIAGEAYEAAKIAGEAAHHVAEVLENSKKAADLVTEATKHFQEEGKQLDSLEPDEDAMKIIRSRSSKTPLFQKILWARYQVEYDRRNARERFRDLLRAALDKGTLAGKPIELARKEFGPAPHDLKSDAVYKQFEDMERRTLRDMLRMYVRRYVSVLRWVRHYPQTVTDIWLISVGLNQPQWDAIYSRFGTKLDKRVGAARRIHDVMDIAYEIAAAMGIRLRPLELQEPILVGVEDLWRFWGAKHFYSEDWWYGKSAAFYQQVDVINATN